MIEALFADVWETLELPHPTFKRREELTEWERRRPLLSRPNHRRSAALSAWTHWAVLRHRNPFHPRARPEVGRRQQRRLEFERAAAAGAPPRITEPARAQRALVLLRRIEPLCRESGRTLELVVCLRLQVVLLAGSLGRPDLAFGVAEELSRLAGAGGESAEAPLEAPSSDVATTLAQVDEFLRDPFREEEHRRLFEEWGHDE